jgi:hypothetical protein
MKLKDLYFKAIDIGLRNDLRPKEEIDRLLQEEKERYEKLSEKEKKILTGTDFSILMLTVACWLEIQKQRLSGLSPA